MTESIFLTLLVVFLLNIHNGNSEPRFIQEPEDYFGFQDKFQNLYAQVDGAEDPRYQWYQNGSKILMVPGTNFGVTSPNLMFFKRSLATQGIYQLFVSSNMGRIFGREIKVEFTIVGKFSDKTVRTVNVVIGKTFQLECPGHTLTQRAVYKWGGTGNVGGTWFFNDRPDVLVLEDGRLFFSHVTRNDVNEIEGKNGISCLLEATHGRDIRFDKSAVFRFNITGEETTAFGPTLEKIPNKEVVEGETLQLRCIAAGYPTPTYKWKKRNSIGLTTDVIDKVDGVSLSEFNKFLVIKNTMKSRHAGTYTCEATIDGNGYKNISTTSNKVLIREKLSWVKGTLIKSAKPNISTVHRWKCMAKGEPEPEYHWYSNATIMQNESARYTIEGGILTFHRVSLEDNGMYQCVAKNKFGFQYQTVSMDVQVKPPKITAALSHQNFVVENTGMISCVSDALPHASHHWLFNGVKIEPKKTAKYKLTKAQNLLVHNLTQNDTGAYTCVAMNMFGKDTKETYIKVAEIMFKRGPENNTNVLEGTSFSLVCDADSDPPLNIRYKWLFEGKDLVLSDKNHITWDLNSRALTVSNAQAQESGVYECIAYSDTSQKSSSATVIVRALPSPPENLRLHGQCTDLTANLTWSISYRSSYEPLTRILIQWRTSRDTSTWYNFSDHVKGSANSYVLKNLNPYSDIVFRVIALNEHGMGKPSNSTKGQECKTRAAKPSVCPQNVTGNSKNPHEIDVTWQTVKSLDYNGPGFGYIVQYRQLGSTIWLKENISQHSEQRFTIRTTSANQLWEFEVKSKNDEGVGPDCSSEQARSAKDAKITFTVRPSNKTDVRKGNPFSLSCKAYSNPQLPMNYKWFHDGKDLGQSGSNFTVSKSRLLDSGLYECVAYVKTSMYNAETRASSTVIVRGPPEAPGDVILKGNCLNFTANLTWTIHRRSYQQLTNISIQWSLSHDTSTWYDVSDHVKGSANGHVVRGLNPYSSLVFRVIAVNEYGQSKPSLITLGQECKTPEAKPTVCPTNVEGSADKPESIVITWKAVSKLHQNGPKFGYTVSYRKPGSQWQHREVNGVERVTISKAGVYQLWQFKVESKNAQGKGTECAIKETRTVREKPKLAPQSFGYKDVGPDYVVLEWTPVDALGIEGYQISYWHKSTIKTRVRRDNHNCTDEKKPCTTRISNITTRQYTLGNLKPHTSYTMYLQAYNGKGEGPKSNILNLNTKEGQPGAPDEVRVTSYGRYLNMTWKPPIEPNGVITGYILKVTNGTNITVSYYTTWYLFEDLEPLKDYDVRINAKNSAGVGSTVSMVVTTTEVRVPAVARRPDVHGLDAESVNVTYRPGSTSKTSGFPEKFYVVYKEKGEDNEMLNATNLTLIKRNGEKSFIIVSGLDNHKTYMFATIVMNGDKKSDKSDFTEGRAILNEGLLFRLFILN
ncbi:contactin-3-like [Dendronephthya gigantea]|uniref:contactin-3-like n=1 Tax=Dendronephthya gigantea TaxID=151771 RepID=UPI00106B70EF|nr:contactin-3-like [Dendronephthya gigantea]